MTYFADGLDFADFLVAQVAMERIESLGYDLSGALERLGGDRVFLAECVWLFKAALPKLMAAIRHSVECRSGEDLHAAAHALKGISSNFVSDGPAATAAELVLLSHSGEWTAAPALIERLERELTLLLDALHAGAES